MELAHLAKVQCVDCGKAHAYEREFSREFSREFERGR